MQLTLKAPTNQGVYKLKIIKLKIFFYFW